MRERGREERVVRFEGGISFILDVNGKLEEKKNLREKISFMNFLY